MPFHKKHSEDTVGIKWRIPVITIVLGATAIPVEFRSLGRASMDFSVDVPDILANLVVYWPVGMVLGELGLARALIAAALISSFAESSQSLMMHRFPSVIDVASNTIGASLGAVMSRRWHLLSPELRVDRSRALVAAALAPVLLFAVWARSGPAPSERGVAAPGLLEAHWRFDEGGGRLAVDSSVHGLNGEFVHRPKRVGGVLGGAIELDGESDCIDFGRSTALRLSGSMSISAWIRPGSFPADDAAIVSGLSGIGFQLDTTVDEGPRTIGFKLTNADGELMARYGKTPLLVDTWYHVAGVYDAGAKSLDVYLNGEPDNGFLLGTVSGRQHSSRGTVYVGRRSDSAGFEFAGLIDDVRIYSLALSRRQIGEVMGGTDIEISARAPIVHGEAAEGAGHAGDRLATNERGRMVSDPEDVHIPAAAVTLGVLAAVACAGLQSRMRAWPCLAISLAAGLILPYITASSLPSFNLFLVPLTSLAGGAAVAVSLTRGTKA